MRKGLIIMAALLAMAAGFYLASELTAPDGAGVQLQGTVLRPARQLTVPELTKHDGSQFSKEDLEGQWTLVFFGYTHCPDICPMTMNVLAEAKQQAGGDFPQVLFVTVDPQRDQQELLGDYVTYFDPDFVGVTGSDDMLKALALQASVVYMKAPGASGQENDYLVDHSSSIMMINPQGELAAFLSAPHTPSSVIDSVSKIRKYY